MSKAVLLSIRPEWSELIANGKKTVEIRKTKPKLETPFKCYIYCTKSKGDSSCCGLDRVENGKIVGEFTCDRIRRFRPAGVTFDDETVRHSCVCLSRLIEYVSDKRFPEDYIFGWHIKNVIIYAIPKELKEFHLLTPPQSWCYVEEAK